MHSSLELDVFLEEASSSSLDDKTINKSPSQIIKATV